MKIKRIIFLRILLLVPLVLYAQNEDDLADAESTESDILQNIETHTESFDLDSLEYENPNNKFLDFDNIEYEELVYRSQNNLMYLYDVRYNAAVKTKFTGITFTILSTFTFLGFGVAAYYTGFVLDDVDMRAKLTPPFAILSSFSLFGGLVPSIIMWNVGAARQINIIREYQGFVQREIFFQPFSR